MMKQLSYASAVATLALFLVLGGSAVAASAIIKRPSQLRNGVVTNKKVKKGTLAVDRLSKKARAALKGARGPAGPQGPAGPVGSIQSAPAGGDLTGSFPNPLIKPLAVLTGHIADDAVSAAKIQDNAVGQGELAANSVGAAELQTDSVGFLELQPLSVLEQNIGPNAVTSAKIDDGTITGSDLAGGSVGSSQLAGNAVTTEKVAPGAIGTTDLDDQSVTTDKIAPFAIDSARLASGSVSRTKLLASGIHNPGNVQIPAEGCIEQTINPPGTVPWTHALITARDIAFGGQQAAPGTIVQGIHPDSGDSIRLQLCTFSNNAVDAPVVDWAVL